MTATVGAAWVRLTRADLEALPDTDHRARLLAEHHYAAELETLTARASIIRELAEQLRKERAALHAALTLAADHKSACARLEKKLRATKDGPLVPLAPGDTPDLIAARRASVIAEWERSKRKGAA